MRHFPYYGTLAEYMPYASAGAARTGDSFRRGVFRFLLFAESRISDVPRADPPSTWNDPIIIAHQVSLCVLFLLFTPRSSLINVAFANIYAAFSLFYATLTTKPP